MTDSPKDEGDGSVALLDTSVQIDRRKMGSRAKVIEELLTKHTETICTGISLLEFKAVFIQQLITIHNDLRRSGARFTTVRDRLTESMHYQAKLRGHIFNNLIQVTASSFEVDEEQDRRLARKARLKIENVIVPVYNWFRNESAGTYLNKTQLNCTRADEPPKKKKLAFSTNLPKCREGKNRFCKVEKYIEEESETLLNVLNQQAVAEDEDKKSQLEKAKDIFEKVLADPDFRMNHSDCRSAGDCLIALEGQNIATVALSTNTKEWETICPAVGMQFQVVEYPDN